MSAPKVTWLGSQKLDYILNHPISTTATTKAAAALGLVLLHGTWNVLERRRNESYSTNTTTDDDAYPKDKKLLTSWMQQAVLAVNSGGAASFSFEYYYAATVQIDLEDDATCNLLIEGGMENDQHQLQIPIPPAELPALALVFRNPFGGVTLRYVSENPLRLLDVVNDDGGNMRTTLGSIVSIADAVQTVVKDLLLEDSLQMQLVDDDATFPVEEDEEESSAVGAGDDDDALRIFVAGDRSSVGKSSVCLGILGSLLKMGYPAKSLAYIKPATQSESTQLIQLYCEKHGVKCVPIGPLVYYRGFTRAFLAGETEPTTTLLKGCQQAVDQVARGRRVVLVDGVGFPAVGSICGTDNVAVLRACSYPRRVAFVADDSDSDNALETNRKPMGVVLVGGSGVGAAVDGFNLNACYFEQRQVPVLGAIFNKLSETGFYSLENCKAEITKYFDQQQQEQHVNTGSLQQQQQKRGRPFGFLPLFPAIAGDKAMDHVEEFLTMFSSHVDVAAILDAAMQVKKGGDASSASSADKNLAAAAAPPPKSKTTSYNGASTATMEQRKEQSPTKRRKLMVPVATTAASNYSAAPKKTREEIEDLAIAGGAAPSA